MEEILDYYKVKREEKIKLLKEIAAAERWHMAKMVLVSAMRFDKD